MICLSTALLVLFLCLQSSYGNVIRDQVSISCDTNPLTGKVNVSYFGEAELAFPMNNGTTLTSCLGDFIRDGTYVITDVNHRNCSFVRLKGTNTWKIQLRVQRVAALETALDKEYNLMCVYDDYQKSSSDA